MNLRKRVSQHVQNAKALSAVSNRAQRCQFKEFIPCRESTPNALGCAWVCVLPLLIRSTQPTGLHTKLTLMVRFLTAPLY